MKKVIQFTRPRFFMISLSVLLILTGAVVGFLRGGFNYGIDFSAGMTQQIRIDPAAVAAPIGEVRQALAPLESFSLQAVGGTEDQQYIIKVLVPEESADFQEQTERQIRSLLGAAFGAQNIEVLQSEFVGSRYSRDLATQTISITVVALVLVLVYTAFRFKFVYGMGAVICLLHDAAFMLAVIAAFQLEFSTATIAAVLTIIGYSLNDTIVIFDRVRENVGLMRESDLETIFNTSITQSLSRTLLTSFTTLLAVGTIFVIGTGDIRIFALNLIIGVVVGTYSTIFIASPIVLGWTRANERHRRARDQRRFGRAAGPGPERTERPVVSAEPTGTVPVRPEKPAPEPPREGTGEQRDTAAAAASVTRFQPTRKKKRKKK